MDHLSSQSNVGNNVGATDKTGRAASPGFMKKLGNALMTPVNAAKKEIHYQIPQEENRKQINFIKKGNTECYKAKNLKKELKKFPNSKDLLADSAACKKSLEKIIKKCENKIENAAKNNKYDQNSAEFKGRAKTALDGLTQ